MSNAIVQFTVGEMQGMARAFVDSGMFGIDNVASALSLLLIAQAEGLHPAKAMQDYHVIQGKPALKADAMLARFQHAGGKVSDWVLTDARVSAKFSHPSGGEAVIEWTMERARVAELGGKGMWKKYPRQMLRARVISEGVRTVYPGILGGFYTPEEVEDFERPAVAPREPAPRAVVETTADVKPAPSPLQAAGDEFADASKHVGEVVPVPEDTPLTCGFEGEQGKKKPVKRPVADMSDRALAFALTLAQENVAKPGRERWRAQDMAALKRLELERDKRAAAPKAAEPAPEAKPEAQEAAPVPVEADVLPRSEKLFVRKLGTRAMKATVSEMTADDLYESKDSYLATLNDPAATPEARSYAMGAIALLEDEAARRGKG